MLRRASLARDFTIFSTAILLAVLCACVVVGTIVHQNYYERQENKISRKAILLDSTLEESFNFVSHYVNFIGNKISKDTNLNEAQLRDLFSTNSYRNLKDINDWTIFSWINAENKIIIRSTDATMLIKEPMNRKYLYKTPTNPGHFSFLLPEVSIFDNRVILPASFAITTKLGKYLGAIGIDFDIKKLADKLRQAFASNELEFILLDNDFNYILSSNNVAHSDIVSLLNIKSVANLRKNAATLRSTGTLLSPLENDQYRFNYYRYSNQYPFLFLVGENKKIANQEYWSIALPRIAELCIMSIFFIITLYYFRRRIIKPLVLLAESAKKIALGNNNVSIDIGQYEEVDLIANQLKDILHAKIILSAAKEDTDLLNLDLELKIKERTADLEKALAIRTEFLNSMSHEVRTPVQGITAIAQGLVEHWHEYTEDKKFALASAVASNGQRLFSLVSNILDLSTFNSGKMHFDMQNQNLINLIEEIITEAKMLYLNNKPINIIFKKHPKEALLVADSEKISQVLRNLITNSIKFMSDGEIEITVLKTALSNESNFFYTVTVKDSGINLPEEDLNNIFLPFVQSEVTRGKAPGTGLGLSICQKIITGHGGGIWAKNNQGKGISVSFTLPTHQKMPIKNIEKKETAMIPSMIKGYILMMDDEATCQMSMDLLLSGTGYILISKYGGISGLEYLNEHYKKIDLIFLDLMMPDMHGLKVLEVIQATPKFAKIPVIIQSGTNNNQEIENTLQCGAKAFIRKPYQRPQIINVINEALSKK